MALLKRSHAFSQGRVAGASATLRRLKSPQNNLALGLDAVYRRTVAAQAYGVSGLETALGTYKSSSA